MQNLESQSLQGAGQEVSHNAQSMPEHVFKSLPLRLGVTFLLNGTKQERGETLEISPVGAIISCDIAPMQDRPVTIYFDNLGRFEGHIVTADAGQFTVSFASLRSKMVRLADALTWAVNASDLKGEKRQHSRHAEDSVTVVTFEDGSTCPCKVTDISVTGASVIISPRPAIGSILEIGKVIGKVARHHDQGVGMVFASPSGIDATRKAIRPC